MLNKNEYMHWKPADWVLSHGMDKFFNMDSTGTLTVSDNGLFLIYAQVIFLIAIFHALLMTLLCPIPGLLQRLTRCERI